MQETSSQFLPDQHWHVPEMFFAAPHTSEYSVRTHTHCPFLFIVLRLFIVAIHPLPSPPPASPPAVLFQLVERPPLPSTSPPRMLWSQFGRWRSLLSQTSWRGSWDTPKCKWLPRKQLYSCTPYYNCPKQQVTELVEPDLGRSLA